MERWFVLFVRTGAEKNLVEFLKSQLIHSENYLPFVLTKEALFWDKGNPVLFKKTLFPGYVMVQTDRAAEEVCAKIKRIIRVSEDKIFKILHYGEDETNIMLRESEQSKWKSLVDSEFCIKASEGVMKGETLKVTSGPLVGREAAIKSLNRYKSKAILDVEFAGELVEMSFVLRIQK